jgi:probable rRNA maturation factor
LKINIRNYFNNEDYSETINLVLKHASNIMNTDHYSINVILVGNEEIKDLNKKYRHKDAVTDVLTFQDGMFHHLGDVFICIPRMIEQSKEYSHSCERELGFLTVHGFLHTLGYDHHTKDQEEEMIALQNRILNKANLSR